MTYFLKFYLQFTYKFNPISDELRPNQGPTRNKIRTGKKER